ncbi:MAG: hypothetical protein ACI9Y1_000609 [Lentisphaeria bacterium]|jgi:hypothetical protein
MYIPLIKNTKTKAFCMYIDECWDIHYFTGSQRYISALANKPYVSKAKKAQRDGN